MLQVDTSRTARSHADKVALIDTLVAAPVGEPETDRVEWKSHVDLTDAEWKFKCAKAILGFGNRDPAAARNHAEGCAYFIAGAEPGKLSPMSASPTPTLSHIAVSSELISRSTCIADQIQEQPAVRKPTCAPTARQSRRSSGGFRRS
jgi:hypothetical protein